MAKRRANGEGTFFKRKDGRWSAQAFITQANGEKKRICFTSKDRNKAIEKLEKALKENERLPCSGKDWIMADYLDYWLNNVQSNQIRETTFTTYRLQIKNHLKPALGKYKLKDLSVYDIRAAIAYLEQRGCKGGTIQKFLIILSACLSCAMREELIYRNVAQLVEKPKYTPKETAIWQIKQAAFFLLKSREHPLYVAFLLLLICGMRRGEVLGIRWCDIDFDNNLIHVRQQIDRINGEIKARDLKTANSHRILPLVPIIRTALLELAPKRRTEISSFSPKLELSTEGTVVLSGAGTPLEPRNLARSFHLLADKLGLPRIKLHATRHTAATILKELNVPVKDVQLILGHANISTTLNIYQHGTTETQRNALCAVGERLLGNQNSNLTSAILPDKICDEQLFLEQGKLTAICDN